MKSKIQINRGYTLVELLAVTSILVILSGIISGIIYSTIRGSGNVRGSTQISQNGVYAVSVIERAISDSRNVTQINGIDIDDCTVPHVGNVGIASITLKRLDKSLTTFSCKTIPSVGGVYTIASGSASLIDTANVEVELDSCTFACSQLVLDPYSIPKVEVSFKIVGKPGNTTPPYNAHVTSSLRVYNP